MTEIAVVPFKRLIQQGTTGRDVVAVKRALKAAGYGKGIVVNPRFGNYAAADLARFQKAHGLKPDGEYGPKTHAKLVAFMDAWGRWLYTHTRVKPPMNAYRLRVVQYCEWAAAHASRFGYEQIRPIPGDPYAGYLLTDCSGFAKLSYKSAQAPSPDGLGWSIGNTTSLQAHGVAVSAPQPGDLVFYRNPDHVGVYVGNGDVIEHGSSVGPRRVSEWYRTVTAIRSYLPRAG